MEENKIQKPLILEMDEAKLEIIKVINSAIQERKLSCYMVDMILSDIYAQIKEGAKQELAMAKQQMNESTEDK